MAVKFLVIALCVYCVLGASIEERAVDTSDLPTDLSTMDLKMRDAHPSKVTVNKIRAVAGQHSSPDLCFATKSIKIYDP